MKGLTSVLIAKKKCPKNTITENNEKNKYFGTDFNMNNLYKVTNIAILIILFNLFQTFSYAETKLSGRITERENDTVTLSIGYDTGVKIGMKFSVYRIDKQILLPLSNEQTLIGSYEIIGQIQITKVKNNTSMGKLLQEGADGKHQIKPMCYVEEANEPPIPNQPPIISSIIINPDTIQPGKQVEVKIDAFDKNSDSLIYTWEADRSYFLSDNTVTPVNYWIAPFEKGEYSITISVSDQRGGFDQMKRTITVSDPGWNDDLGNYVPIRTFKNNLYSGYDSDVLNVLDVDFDSKNNMYVLDPKEKGISVFDPNGRYLKTLCTGRFNSPNELLIEDDKLYIIYDNNKFVDRYDFIGNQEVTYNKKKTSEYEMDVLRKPIACATGNEGELYIIDGIGPDIAIFEKNGRFRLRFGNGAIERGELVNPVSIRVDRGGNIYVLDTGKGEIIVYNPRMQYQRSIKFKTKEISDMYLDKRKEQFYLVNGASNTVLVIDTSGKTIQEFGQLRDPLKISMDRFSNIYVTNKIESCIYKFMQREDTYKYYGKFGTNPFTRITNIAVNKDGSIFLLNESSSEIIKVNRNGWELTRFGSKNVEGKTLEKPTSIVAGEGGKYIYILDRSRKEVLQFSNEGEFLKIVTNQKEGKVADPIDIASDTEGNLYVVDMKSDVCFVYNKNGAFIAQIGTKGKKGDFEYLYKPTRVAVEPDGKTVYVFDDNSKLRKINVYTRNDSDNSYPFLRYDKASDAVSLLKVNNYNRLMVAYTSESNSQGISFIGKNGTLERTLTGKDGFSSIKDIEVDDTENIYILNANSNVQVFKQQKLLQEK
ncbi:MAG TPA: 6-bladed beta-propeller [Candidatus Brocadiaceae bacterium]